MEQQPIDLRQSQLFLDETWVADSRHVFRTWHRARKRHEPVLTAESPEEGVPLLYGGVLRDGGLFRMWYIGWLRDESQPCCYAESRDGI